LAKLVKLVGVEDVMGGERNWGVMGAKSGKEILMVKRVKDAKTDHK